MIDEWLTEKQNVENDFNLLHLGANETWNNSGEEKRYSAFRLVH